MPTRAEAHSPPVARGVRGARGAFALPICERNANPLLQRNAHTVAPHTHTLLRTLESAPNESRVERRVCLVVAPAAAPAVPLGAAAAGVTSLADAAAAPAVRGAKPGEGVAKAAEGEGEYGCTTPVPGLFGPGVANPAAGVAGAAPSTSPLCSSTKHTMGSSTTPSSHSAS